MAEPGVLPADWICTGGAPTSAALQGSPNSRPSRSPSPVHIAGIQPTRMRDIRCYLSAQGMSDDATKFALNSWAENTQKQYDSALRVWIQYNGGKSCPPTDTRLANFLAYLKAEKELQYGTIACYKAAICSFYGAMQSLPDMHVVDRVTKGIFRENPPKPKYGEMWEVSKVLAHLRSWGPTSSLTRKALTLKTVMLVALASPKRVSELAALSIDSVQKGKAKWTFLLGMTKNRQRGGACHSAVLERFREPDICPLTTLEAYLERTKGQDRPHNVFVSYTKPFGPVTPTTISRWIKSIIAGAGYTSYGAHSTRAASTTTARLAGLSSTQILEAANWAPNSTVFEKYYFKGPTESFQKAVLSARKPSTKPNESTKPREQEIGSHSKTRGKRQSSHGERHLKPKQKK